MGILEKVFGKIDSRTKSIDTSFGTIQMIIPGNNFLNEWFEANKTQFDGMDGWFGGALILKTFSKVKDFNDADPTILAEEMKKSMTPGDLKSIFGYFYWLFGMSQSEVTSLVSSSDFRQKG